MQETITKSELLNKLGRFIEVRPIYSERSGEAVRNQYEVAFENGSLFQSYETVIAVYYNSELYLSSSHDCSNTTSKYCTYWTRRSPKERREGLKSGVYTLIID